MIQINLPSLNINNIEWQLTTVGLLSEFGFVISSISIELSEAREITKG
jgi:hypothetical protein